MSYRGPARGSGESHEMYVERMLRAIHRKVVVELADITQLQAALDTLDTDEQAAAAALQNLATELANLQAGTVSQAQIDALTQHATSIAQALSTATGGGSPPAPSGG